MEPEKKRLGQQVIDWLLSPLLIALAIVMLIGFCWDTFVGNSGVPKEKLSKKEKDSRKEFLKLQQQEHGRPF